MRITRITTLHADGGWRVISFLKLETDAGLVGWSEYSESICSRGLTGVIAEVGALAVGRDPRAFARLAAELGAASRAVSGGLAQQAIAAIANACIDVAGKAAGVPAYRLFGGPYRDRIPLYWSHCGTFRAVRLDFFETVIGTAPLRRVEDFTGLGREVHERGFTALKTNPVIFSGQGAVMRNPGFIPSPHYDFSGSNRDFPRAAIEAQLAALRAGAGGDVDIMLDLNFSLNGDGMLRVGRLLDGLGLAWLEIDTLHPAALAELRARIATPIASGEALYGLHQYRPFIEARAADVVLIDAVWNGVHEAVRIATFAEAHQTNVAPHNCFGHLATLMSAHFAAAVPNVRIMEIEVDDVGWHADFVTRPPRIESGALILDEAPGWGADIDEDAVRAHPVPGAGQGG